MALHYHYTRITVSLARLGIVALLEKYGLSIESLSEDISEVFREPALQPLKEIAMLYDYLGILQETYDATIEEDKLIEELQLLFKEVAAKFNGKERVRAVHLELPDNLILECEDLLPFDKMKYTALQKHLVILKEQP